MVDFATFCVASIGSEVDSFVLQDSSCVEVDGGNVRTIGINPRSHDDEMGRVNHLVMIRNDFGK